jgi:nucleoside-triphosphatase
MRPENLIPKNILITGTPGVGKTTLFRQVACECVPYRPVGFFTGEIREQGVRVGFSLTGLDGGEGVLSHVAVRGRYHVGKYTVDIEGFEAFIEDILITGAGTRLVMIDEIGKMECLSPRFRRRVREILDSGTPCVATVALRGDAGIDSIKARDDTVVYRVTRDNREVLGGEIIGTIRELVEITGHPG